MDFNEYQEKCKLFDIGTSAQDFINPGWIYYVLGIAEESGELVGKIKKLFRDKKGVIDDEFKEAIVKEIGDFHWYSARLLAWFGIEYNEVPKKNMEKLLDRTERNAIHGSGDDR